MLSPTSSGVQLKVPFVAKHLKVRLVQLVQFVDQSRLVLFQLVKELLGALDAGVGEALAGIVGVVGPIENVLNNIEITSSNIYYLNV